jgi:hypothetical protein
VRLYCSIFLLNFLGFGGWNPVEPKGREKESLNGGGRQAKEKKKEPDIVAETLFSMCEEHTVQVLELVRLL